MAKNKKKTIAVTGATGHQGGAVMHHLRERGFAVRALSRNPDKPDARALIGPGVEVLRADLKDEASLISALDGAEGVYSVQSRADGVEEEIRQGLNVANAAKRSRINLLVYSSVGSADQKTGIPHFDSKFRIEEHIRGTGLRYTILRPVFFMENLLQMREQIDQGVLSLPLAPDTRLQMVAVDDIGAVAAMAFERPGHWQGRAVELAGDERSMTELAADLGRMAGREVRYEQVPWEQFEQKIGREEAIMFRWFQETGYHADISALRQEYPNLTSFEKWLHSKWTRVLTA